MPVAEVVGPGHIAFMKNREIVGSKGSAADRTVVPLHAGPFGAAEAGEQQPDTKHADDIVAQIEQDLILGRRAPGSRLDERALAERFGVSRTPVREALHRLSARGLVVPRGRQGAQVALLPVGDLLDAFFVVAELEGMAALFAARRTRPGDKVDMLAAQDRCATASAAGDETAFVGANAAFHDAILRASRNRLLQEQLHTARLVVAPYRYLATFQPNRMAASIPEHGAVLDAIFAGEGQAAASLMTRHVNLLGDHLSDLLHSLQDHIAASEV